ncbi:heterokaryon incompatibility protein-domain-containing protein, partial [Xylariales sp. PMI_506]
MRLIHVESYKIVEFFGENIPVYAILSHTWQDDEVSFSDMQDWLPNDNFVADQPGLRRLSPTVRSKKGFRKIEYTCRQARNHNLGWAWVDTCCIDKTSSSELTEAINSMFQWYQKAARCYAYLADVLNLDRAPKKQLEQRIMASRWFTRGWTLQELIAPKNMTFYSQEWEYLCERVELDNVIAKTTSIPTELMQFGAARSSGPGLQAYSVAQRMSWAANRRCTRLEDTAYSLLGIFDINMPLLYGEGNNAFLRLQEEIFRSTDDHSLLAW